MPFTVPSGFTTPSASLKPAMRQLTGGVLDVAGLAAQQRFEFMIRQRRGLRQRQIGVGRA